MSGLIRALPAFFAFLAGRRAGQQSQAEADRRAADKVVAAEREADAKPVTPGDIIKSQEDGSF